MIEKQNYVTIVRCFKSRSIIIFFISSGLLTAETTLYIHGKQFTLIQLSVVISLVDLFQEFRFSEEKNKFSEIFSEYMFFFQNMFFSEWPKFSGMFFCEILLQAKNEIYLGLHIVVVFRVWEL